VFCSLLQEYGAVDDLDKISNFLSIGQASDYLGVSIDTLRRWEKRGRVTPYRSPGGHRYYKKQELDLLFGKRYTHDRNITEDTERTGKTEELSETVSQSGSISVESNSPKPFFVIEEQIPPAPPPPRDVLRIPEVQMIAIGRNQSRFSQFAGVQSALKQSGNGQASRFQPSYSLSRESITPTILIPHNSGNSENKKSERKAEPGSIQTALQRHLASISASKDLIKNVILIIIMVFIIILGMVFLIMFWQSQSVLSPSP
jgi:excisionase family DNA binding protein